MNFSYFFYFFLSLSVHKSLCTMQLAHTRGGNSIKKLPPLWKWEASKRKELSKFFHFWADSFSERLWYADKQRGSHKSCLPCKIKQKKNPPKTRNVSIWQRCPRSEAILTKKQAICKRWSWNRAIIPIIIGGFYPKLNLTYILWLCICV